jgi:nucleotide-binding universal stress UspA family protein
MTNIRYPITAAVDGSQQSVEALHWATAEAARRNLPLSILHTWLSLTPRHRESRRRAAEELLAQAEHTARGVAPNLEITLVAATDLPAAALAHESRHATMVVLGSRGGGGFGGLLIGSNSLMTAAIAHCPVVVVHGPVSLEENEPDREIVVGIDPNDDNESVLAFAFETAATRRPARVRVVHGWTMTSSFAAGGPMFDQATAATDENRLLAEITAGWTEKYPQVETVRECPHTSPAKALVGASATAALTVVGRKLAGSDLGLRLGPVAHATLTHSLGPVAVVPY